MYCAGLFAPVSLRPWVNRAMCAASSSLCAVRFRSTRIFCCCELPQQYSFEFDCELVLLTDVRENVWRLLDDFLHGAVDEKVVHSIRGKLIQFSRNKLNNVVLVECVW